MRTQLRDGETVILELRRHWIVLARAAFWTGLFLVLGIVLLSFSTSVASVIALAVAVCMGLRFAYKLYERKVDLWAVTNRRVIDESGVFSHSSKDSPLDKINNISYQQTLWGRMLGYGTVQIQTAAGMGATTDKFVETPQKLKDTITRCQEENKHAASDEQTSRLAQAIAATQRDEGETRDCPFCAERIKAKAKICRFCGRRPEERMSAIESSAAGTTTSSLQTLRGVRRRLFLDALGARGGARTPWVLRGNRRTQ